MYEEIERHAKKDMRSADLNLMLKERMYDRLVN